MPRIAEKLEFIKGRAVKVCAKARIGRKGDYQKPCSSRYIHKDCLGKDISWPFKVNIVRLFVPDEENYVF